MVPDRLTAIFAKQRELTLRFHPVELQNRLSAGSYDRAIPVDLTTFRGQETARSHAWRVVEEVAEVLQAMQMKTREDVIEEISDVFHFVVELMIICDVNEVDPNVPMPTSMPVDPLSWIFDYVPTEIYPSRSEAWLDFIQTLGDAIHELKFRAWKANPAPTDPKVFKRKLNDMFHAFIAAVKTSGFTAGELHAAYFSKNQVNHERIDAAS